MSLAMSRGDLPMTRRIPILPSAVRKASRKGLESQCLLAEAMEVEPETLIEVYEDRERGCLYGSFEEPPEDFGSNISKGQENGRHLPSTIEEVDGLQDDFVSINADAGDVIQFHDSHFGGPAVQAAGVRVEEVEVDVHIDAPREATKASKNYANRSLLHLDSLQTAIALHEETEMAIHGQYLKTIGDEINSSKSKATLATLARHFRLQRLNDVLIEIVEMECGLERWHKMVKSELPQNFESCVQNSTKKLEEVSKVLHNKWVSNKAIIDAHYCLKDGKYLETKIAQFHDSMEETLRVLFDLVGNMSECSEEYTHVPEIPFSKFSIHKKITELPGKYVVVQC
ncbi:uncharacterized protein LOC135494729 [Lineus longissimus]|uniref:uncharacterized protein LOC135494729 n=1 Tax=Lineus longissimus TaxID=88925 RepID=UPI00315D0295